MLSMCFIQNLLSVFILSKSVCSLFHTSFKTDFIIATRVHIGSTHSNRKRANINNAGEFMGCKKLKRDLFFALQQK